MRAHPAHTMHTFYADIFNYLRAAALGELESQALIWDIVREIVT